MIDKLEVLLKEGVGRKYGLSVNKILQKRKETVAPKTGTYIDEDRKFFCSELIAKAYKVLGILDDNGRASSSYYPSSFSSKDGDLKLNPKV